MDIKGLLNSEDALPTLQRNLSTTTASISAKGLAEASNPMNYVKFGASGIMGLLGMVYLAQGKKENDLGKMLLGGGLTIGSLFIF